MTDLYFPEDIPSPSWPYKEEYENTSITSKFEDGSMQSRTKFTKSRRTFTLSWNNIERRDYLKLMHFVRDIAKFSANSFIWKNIDSVDELYGEWNPDQEEVEVRITDVGEWTNEALHFWSGELELTEV